MFGIVMIVFASLLLLGVPIAFVVIGAGTLGVTLAGTNLTVIVQQLFSGMNSFTMLAVPFFIMSGNIAAKGATSQHIINVINAYIGRFRGGLGMATVLACVFFGSITGSSIATVVAIGAMMMPKLYEAGYPKGLVIGIMTAAGTLGVMIPPSVPMLTYSITMGTSVSRLFTAGFVPGILTALGFCVYVYFVARKKNVPKQERKLTAKERRAILKEAIWALLFPVFVLGSIYTGIATPTEAAVISLFYIIIIELFVYKSIKFKDMFPLLKKSCVSAATLGLSIACAKTFVWYLTTQQIPTMMYEWMVSNFTSGAGVMLAICALFLVWGCFANVITLVTILGPVMAGVLQHYGFDLIHFGVIVIMMAQVGFLTPPFGLCLFVTMREANASMQEVSKAVIPFILIMLIMTIAFIFLPDLVMFLPNLLMGAG